MKKFWVIGNHKHKAGQKPDGAFNSKDDAVAEAKRRAAYLQKNGYADIVYVYEAIQATEAPVPDIKMVDLTD